jgi:hypothetical protein
MSCVFQNIDPPIPSPPGECVPSAFVAGGGHTRRVGRGVNILEAARHSSVLYTYIESSLLHAFNVSVKTLRLKPPELLNFDCGSDPALNSGANPDSQQSAAGKNYLDPSYLAVNIPADSASPRAGVAYTATHS